MNKVPKISVITPVYNGMPYIEECINSVLSQDFKDWELIISDNCSTDDTVDYLKTITDPRIKIFYQTENLGIFGNLNFAFTKASASISQILCADDYFMSNTSLAFLVKIWAQTNEKVGLIRLNQNNINQKELPNEKWPSIIESKNASLYFFILGNFMGNLTNASLRTNVIKDAGYFNQKIPYAGDFEFWYRASKTTDIAINNDVFTYVRRHEGVASNYLNTKGELLEQKVIIINQIFKDITAKYPKSLFKLKLHGTLCFDAIQRKNAYFLRYKGNKTYLKNFNQTKSKALFCFRNEFVRYILFLLSFGGKFGRRLTASMLFKLLKNN